MFEDTIIGIKMNPKGLRGRRALIYDSLSLSSEARSSSVRGILNFWFCSPVTEADGKVLILNRVKFTPYHLSVDLIQ